MPGIRVQRVSRLVLAVVALGAAAGCAAMSTGMRQAAGPLPEAMRTVGSDLSGTGYPNLSRVPQAPVTLPSDAQWTQFQGALTQEERALAATPEARPLTEAETSLAWSEAERARMDADPRSAPAQGTDAEAEAWAEGERARMEALLLRLPPVSGVPN